MNKSVLALAVLGAFAGAAAAQSSVTLYGRLDTTINYSEPGTGDGTWKMNGSAPIGGSRWGLRGTEDLGGGLKANFVLESGFNSDTGAPGNSSKLFDRLAWVGLSSSMGSISFGRQDTMTRTLNLGYSDISGEGELTVVDPITATGAAVASRQLFQNFGSRVDNSVKYISPNFSGFQFQALVAAGEGPGAARQQGVLLGYSGGPLKAGLSYEMYGDGPGSSSFNEVFTVGGSFNFGPATLLVSYQDTSDLGTQTGGETIIGGDNVDHEAINVGVLVPFGNFQFRAQYTRSEIDTVIAEPKQSKYGASLRYSLSKRTQLYTVVTKRQGSQDELFAKETEVAVGIGHNF
ncbi:MAG TPA: porin [Methylibium sp.]|nr:porin [Methylibium sp.]